MNNIKMLYCGRIGVSELMQLNQKNVLFATIGVY